MTLHAVTVFGPDRPGIVAETTAALAEHGGNLEDSTMTLLRGHFAMVLLVRTTADQPELQAALAGLAADGRLSVAVRPVQDSPKLPTAAGVPYLLRVHGADRPGIVSALTGLIAASGGSVTDLSTRLAGGLYVLLAEVLLPPTVSQSQLAGHLQRTAADLGVECVLGQLDPDEL
jgi:glycine cleavage system transcriptional repressor